jgi:hypothetical protein
MAEEVKYKRLTRARPRSRFSVVSAGQSSLWLGPDHLLCIDSTGFTENYKRFYFRDIQAFIIRKTDGYKYWSIAWGILAFFFAFLAAITRDSVGRTVLLSIGAFFGLCMLLNLALGPTTVCQLQTAVQNELLPSIHRLRKARKVLNIVRPLIASAQGELAPAEIAARFSGTASPATQQPATTGSPPIISSVSPAAGDSGDASDLPPRIVS